MLFKFERDSISTATLVNQDHAKTELCQEVISPRFKASVCLLVCVISHFNIHGPAIVVSNSSRFCQTNSAQLKSILFLSFRHKHHCYTASHIIRTHNQSSNMLNNTMMSCTFLTWVSDINRLWLLCDILDWSCLTKGNCTTVNQILSWNSVAMQTKAAQRNATLNGLRLRYALWFHVDTLLFNNVQLTYLNMCILSACMCKLVPVRLEVWVCWWSQHNAVLDVVKPRTFVSSLPA